MIRRQDPADAADMREQLGVPAADGSGPAHARDAVRESLHQPVYDPDQASPGAPDGAPDGAPGRGGLLGIDELGDTYELLGEIGRGGSAIVYRARDRELGRDVAIKVVRSRFGADDEAIARLAREARTVAQLQHPNIVTVHAVKRLRDEGLALVMQFVPGRTLKQAVLQDGPLPAEQVERVLRDVASALAFAHARGVVHRDVKPENIFLDDASGRALLSDFGIAQSNEFDSRLTMTGTAIGTPAYMAPEQIDGKPADARSDVYSLGLVAWEMLTGQRPWEGESLYSVIYKQKHDELPPVDTLRAGVPPRLQYIVERMLQKRPAARWAGADGLLAHMNASVLPADWSQWQEAHRRRRARAKTETTRKPGFVSAALATIRFRRPEPGDAPSVAAGDTTIALQESDFAPRADGSSASGVSRVAAPRVEEPDDADDPTPSWARHVPERRSTGKRVAVGAVLALMLGSLATFALGRRDGERVPQIATLADSSTVEVPFGVPNADSLARLAQDSAAAHLGAQQFAAQDSAAQDSLLREARTRDSLAEAGRESPDLMPPMGARVVAARPLAGASAGRLVRDTAVASPARPPARAAVPPVTTSLPPATASLPSPVPGTNAGAAGPAAAGASEGTTVRSTDDRAIIAAGGRHTCAVYDGRVLCWGGNEAGQLGDGEAEARTTPAGIAGEIDLISVSAGISHNCGVTRGNDAFCWGSNEHGQLGDATSNSRSAPVRVAGNANFRTVRAGLMHSCGVSTSGLAYCWGRNDDGQLGDGSASTRVTPAAVAGGHRFVSISAGWRHSCGIATDGTAHCWGANSTGQLGDGTRSARRTPAAVSGGVRFTSIAAGNAHSCAVSESGEAYCWGRNDAGQLGTGGTTDRLTPTRVNTAVRFVSVTVGSVHSCARTAGGAAYCWGRNVYGQLGDGTTVNRDAPVRVSSDVAFTALNAAGAHTCGATSGGETVCWGYNIDGQLGDGTRNHRARPARVSVPAGGR